MFGPSGLKAYTASVLQILRSAKLVKVNPPKYYEAYDQHKSCEQARYQARQQNRRDEQVIKANRLGRVQKNETVNYQ